MKKTYTKPMLTKEGFSMSESVAAGCGYLAGIDYDKGPDGKEFNNPAACTWTMGDLTFFTDPGIGCVITDADESTVCYNGVAGGMPVFRS